jgi:hypothetical protein
MAALDECRDRVSDGGGDQLVPADILFDGMRGPSSIWYRIRINLQPGPQDQRPRQTLLLADSTRGGTSQRRSSAAADRTARVMRATSGLSSFRHRQNSGTSRCTSVIRANEPPPAPLPPVSPGTCPSPATTSGPSGGYVARAIETCHNRAALSGSSA